ncbi:MAG TPA: DUF2304 domain-containing protein [Bacteroidia bacterium]|jgi:hypothetical protein|nr:DUF2304 domain-containing protein [Bacteroidia bacterium]
MERVQLIAIIGSLCFLAFIASLVIRGKLREEYAIIWIICSIVLIVFASWREGLNKLAHLFGFELPSNLIFTGAIFAVMIYLLHLSVVVSKLQEQNKTLAQDIALLKEKDKKKND